MRTREQLALLLRRKLNDKAAATWSTAELLDALDEALGDVINAFLDDPRGLKLLTCWSDAESMAAETEEYDLPDDCLRLLGVEVRADSAQDWLPLAFRAPPRVPAISSGTVLLVNSGTEHIPIPVYWYNDTEQGQVRIWPEMATVSGQEYRFKYLFRPELPCEDEGLPSGFDMLVVYRAASNLGFEELEDGKSISAFAGLYGAKLKEYLNGQGGEQAPAARRFIKGVR